MTDPDVVLIADGQRFPCYRHTLRNASPYFRAMFASNMKESNASEIEIRDVEPETLKILLDFASGGRIQITKETVNSLLRASAIFRFEWVLNRCCDFMLEIMDVANCINAWILGDLLGLALLCRASLLFTTREFMKFVKDPTFKSCPSAMLIEIIKSDGLLIDKEASVVNAVSEWIYHNSESCTEEIILHILSNLRYNFLEYSDLWNLWQIDIIQNSITSKYFFFCLSKYWPEGNRDKNFESQNSESLFEISHYDELAKMAVQLRKRSVSAVMGIVSCAPHLTVSYLDEENLLFKQVTHKPMDKPLQGYVICTVGKSIYFLGGEYKIGSGKWNTSVYKYSTAKNRWRHISTMPIYKRHCKTVVVDHLIYLLGGFGRFRVVLDSVDIFNTHTGEWSSAAPVPCPIFSAVVAASSRGELFLFACQVYKYEPERKSWRTIMDIPSDITEHVAAFSLDEKIFIVPRQGGQFVYFDTMSHNFIRLGEWPYSENNICQIKHFLYCFENETVVIFDLTTLQSRSIVVQNRPSFDLCVPYPWYNV